MLIFSVPDNSCEVLEASVSRWLSKALQACKSFQRLFQMVLENSCVVHQLSKRFLLCPGMFIKFSKKISNVFEGSLKFLKFPKVLKGSRRFSKILEDFEGSRRFSKVHEDSRRFSKVLEARKFHQGKVSDAPARRVTD